MAVGTRVNILGRRIFGSIDLKNRFLDFLEETIVRAHKMVTTGPGVTADPGAWLDSVSVIDGAGANAITFSACYGVDGIGELISVDAGDPEIVEVPFEDTPATTYYMAGHVDEYPEGVEVDTQTSTPIYDRWTKYQGVTGIPASVADDGDGTLTATLGPDHKLDPLDDYTGRTAIIWLDAGPSTNDAGVAIETVTIGAGNTVATVGSLGQTTISTTAADYRIALVGPTITRDTSVQSLGGYAFIGTVVGGGAPRTYDFANQARIAPLSAVHAVPDNVLHKGWISRPSVTAAPGSGSASWSVGTLFSNGQIYNCAPGSYGTLNPTTEYWLYYDLSTGATEVVEGGADWQTANYAWNVPLYYFKTGGGGNISHGGYVGRYVQQFPEVLRMTCSAEADHRGSFRELRSALLAAYGIISTSSPAPQGVEIEVIGDTVESPMNEEEIMTLRNVTIRGRGGRASPNAAYQGGSMVSWSDNSAALFTVSGGSYDLRDWFFEDLCFGYNGNGSGGVNVAVLSVPTGSADGIEFRRCSVDGRGNGPSTGTLPTFIHSGATLDNLLIEDCVVETTDRFLNGTPASDGFRGLTVRGCKYNGDASPIHGDNSFIIDNASSSDAQDWRIEKNRIYVYGSGVLVANKLVRARFEDNDVTLNIDANGIIIGDASNYDSAEVWIENNRIESTDTGGPTSGLLEVHSRYGGIFIRGNWLLTADPTGGISGIIARSNTVATGIRGWIIEGNIVREVYFGIVLGDYVKSAMVRGNWIHCTGTGIVSSNNCDYIMAAGNFVYSEGTLGIALRGTNPMAVGNHARATSASAASAVQVGIDDGDLWAVLVGNFGWLESSSSGSAILADCNHAVLVGNAGYRGDAGVETGTSGGKDRTVVTGNLGTGTTDGVRNNANDSVLDGNNGAGNGVVDSSVSTTVGDNEA
jgi:hypothetical protein